MGKKDKSFPVQSMVGEPPLWSRTFVSQDVSKHAGEGFYSCYEE